MAKHLSDPERSSASGTWQLVKGESKRFPGATGESGESPSLGSPVAPWSFWAPGSVQGVGVGGLQGVGRAASASDQPPAASSGGRGRDKAATALSVDGGWEWGGAAMGGLQILEEALKLWQFQMNEKRNNKGAKEPVGGGVGRGGRDVSEGRGSSWPRRRRHSGRCLVRCGTAGGRRCKCWGPQLGWVGNA